MKAEDIEVGEVYDIVPSKSANPCPPVPMRIIRLQRFRSSVSSRPTDPGVMFSAMNPDTCHNPDVPPYQPPGWGRRNEVQSCLRAVVEGEKVVSLQHVQKRTHWRDLA